jgi:hypothetical protein
LDTDQKSYKRLFQQSWLELEKEFRKGNMNPRHENDIVCYLYHALAKRFKRKGFPLHWIRTEDTRKLRKGQLRPDLNLNDRVFVEVKKYALRDYGKGWKRRQQSIGYNVEKLKQYVAHTKATSSGHVRTPVLAIWFMKSESKKDKRKPTQTEDKLINEDLRKMLERERRRYGSKATLIYGPRKAKR